MERLEIRQTLLECVDQLDVVADARHLGGHATRRVGVVPEIGPGRLLLELGEPRPVRVDVQVRTRVVDPPPEVGEVVGEIAHGETR